MSQEAKLYQISAAPAKTLLCPSAQPDMQESRVLGVMTGTAEARELAYLNEPLPVSDELLATAAPASPTEVFRFAAHCEEKACAHFDGAKCRLATRVVQILPAVTDALPVCMIRSTCRWYQQEGRAACMRCPQVITETREATPEFVQAALGESPRP